jgi:hypothetical protein
MPEYPKYLSLSLQFAEKKKKAKSQKPKARTAKAHTSSEF